MKTYRVEIHKDTISIFDIEESIINRLEQEFEDDDFRAIIILNDNVCSSCFARHCNLKKCCPDCSHGK